MEERDARRVRHYDIAIGVEQFLRRDRALVVMDPVDVTRRDLPAATDLQVARPEVDVRGGEAQPLALIVVLNRQVVGHPLDDVRVQRLGRRRLDAGLRARGKREGCQKAESRDCKGRKAHGGDPPRSNASGQCHSTSRRGAKTGQPLRWLRALDYLDSIPVRVADEADAGAALADGVGRPLRLDPLLRERAESAVEVVDRDRDVAVAGADLIGAVLVLVPGQLEPRAVARESHEDVDRLVADREPGELLEAELLVEADRAIDVRDAVAGVDQLAHRWAD